MIRQTRTYLVGAMSGATLIAIAIAAFVLLVSAQVFSDWPLSALRGSGEEAAVSSGEAVPGAGGTVATATATRSGGGATAAGGGGAGGGAAKATGVAGTPVAAATDGEGTDGGGEGGSTGDGAGAGSNPGTTPGAAGSGGGEASPGSSSGSSAGSSGGSSGGSAGGGSGGATTTSTSSTVTETVNKTVSGVDQAALGGTLEKTGVTGVTESVVNGVAGPESAVGKVVDETAKAVGNLLTPQH